MTYAPPTLTALGQYLVTHDAVNLGIVGDASHLSKGTSYHLGRSSLTDTAYSRQTARDKAGLTEAASAIDVGLIDGTIPRLREFSVWFVGECRRNAPGTSDIREFIYSPDGIVVLRWDRERGISSEPKSGEADSSHRTHSHVSWYRDSETRDKIAPFRGFFEGDDMAPTAQVTERWHPTTTNGQSNGVLRASMDRAAPIVKRVPANEYIVTVAEFVSTAGNWRLVQTADRSVLYALRSDWISDGPVMVDCKAAIAAAYTQGDAAGAKAVKDAAAAEALLHGG